jgi:hypothetical protein
MPRERGERRWPGMLTSGGAALGALLAPKCPFCVLAILSTCGLGVGMGTAGMLAMVMRPVAALIAIVALLVVIAPAFRRARRARGSARRATATRGCPACDANG